MIKLTNFKFMFLAVLFVGWVAGPHPGLSAGTEKLQAAPLPADGVIIYQFHRRFRCDACYKLEEAINEALQTHFLEEVKEGKVIYKVIDLDAKGSEDYGEKYDFFYNTVIVVDIQKGKETRFKNLEEVWGMVDQKDAAIEFIRSEVADYL